jgi:hypothetical protein
MGSRNGKDLIVSIILPDVATMISNASGNIDLEHLDDFTDDETNRYAFRHYTNLKSITGRNIRLIGTFAFYNCASLTEVNFPNTAIVMQYAFYGCTGITSFNFERLRHIMPSAFEGCTSLERVEFHTVDIIPQRAFMNCTSLTYVSFSNVRTIEPEAFRNCTNLREARFHVNPWPRTTSGHPLDTYRAGHEVAWSSDTVAFHNNVFRGCTSLEILDVRNAWNVYFGAGALAEIGTTLSLHLFDDNGTRSYGHPQTDWLLGGGPIENGTRSLTSLIITASSVSPFEDSQILYADYQLFGLDDNDPIALRRGYASIRNHINSNYNPGDRDEYNNPINPIVEVRVERRPALPNN